ncbi:MAG: hypothetical protein LUC91_00710, partial [Prevotella sp.]|nr:hypothetical protein [Prevotella sp.]
TTPVIMETNTTLTKLPRNNIFPLVISLDNYELELTVEAYTAGIGTSQTIYTNDDRDEDPYLYIINLREITSSFTITPNIYDVSSTEKKEVDGITWDWTADNGSLSFDKSDGILTVTELTATNGYEEEYTLSASWDSDDGHNIKRTYTMLVKFSYGDFTITGQGAYNAPAYNPWGSAFLPQERLNMTTSKRLEQNIKEGNGL